MAVTSTAWVGLRRRGERHQTHAVPRLLSIAELVVEHPPVAGVTAGIQRGPADGDVVGHVEPAAGERVPVVQAENHLGAVPADGQGEVSPQRYAVLDHPIGVTVEELHGVNPDHRGGPNLLVGSQRPALLGRDRVDAGLSPGDEQIADLLALIGPPGHGGRGPVLGVVGVGHDEQGPVPVLGESLHAPIVSGWRDHDLGGGGQRSQNRRFNVRLTELEVDAVEHGAQVPDDADGDRLAVELDRLEIHHLAPGLVCGDGERSRLA